MFLDDIDEIVRVLVDATEKRVKSIRPDKDAKIVLTFAIKDQVCDEAQELPKIAKKTFDLSVEVDVPDSAPWASLEFDRSSTFLMLIGFTTLEQLSIYHKLAPVFRRRNLWLATLVHSHSWLVHTVLLLLTLVNIALYASYHQHPPMLFYMFWLLFLALVAIEITTASHHSTIILRHLSERSALRQDLLGKILPVATGCVLTFLLTVLGFYIKHKYWP